jgi:Spy/CpxP family protein refolding chaperone
MKRWLKTTLVGLFGTAVLVGGLSACGHGGPRGDWAMGGPDSTQMRERMLERATRELKLDDAQKQRLAVLADKVQAQRKTLMGTTDPRTELQALVAGPTFDRAGAQALVEAKTAALRSGSPEVIAAAGDFFDSLSPAQQQQVRSFMAERGHGHHRS